MAANLNQLTAAIVVELRGYLEELRSEGSGRSPGYEAELVKAIVQVVRHTNDFRAGASSKIIPLVTKVCTGTGQHLIDDGWRP